MGVYSDTPVAYLRHTEIDGEAVVSDLDGVVEGYEARGWVRVGSVPAHLDPDAPNQPEPEPEAEEAPPKKRARKSEPEAESANPTTPEGDEVNG